MKYECNQDYMEVFFIIMVGLPSSEIGVQPRLYGSASIVIARVNTSTVFCILFFGIINSNKRRHESKRQKQDRASRMLK